MYTHKPVRAPSIDIILSYEKTIHDSVISLYNLLLQNYDLTIWIDCYALSSFQKNPELRKTRAIIESKMFICCLTKEYVASRKCKNELILGFASGKPIMVLLFEDLRRQDYDTIFFALDGATKIQVYSYTSSIELWSGSLFLEVCMAIQAGLNRKLQERSLMKQETVSEINSEVSVSSMNNSGISMSSNLLHQASSTPMPVTSNENKDSNIIEIRIEDTNETTTTATKNTTTSATPTPTTKSKEKDDPDNFFIDPALVRLHMQKTNSLFKITCGYNRMAYLESKKYYLVTSSYNKSIILLDIDGNWIERRNPGGLLKKPWAICVSREQEIFIGDNALKAILVFDNTFKHLYTFAKNMLNGYYDIAIDYNKNRLYSVSLYDSEGIVIDLKRKNLLNRFNVSVPTFVRINENQAFVLSADDLLYVLDKEKLEIKRVIEIKNSKYLNSLFVFNESIVILSSYEMNGVDKKSKEIYLILVKLEPHNFIIKKVNLGITHLNDMVISNDRLISIDDTHINIFRIQRIDMVFY